MYACNHFRFLWSRYFRRKMFDGTDAFLFTASVKSLHLEWWEKNPVFFFLSSCWLQGRGWTELDWFYVTQRWKKWDLRSRTVMSISVSVGESGCESTSEFSHRNVSGNESTTEFSHSQRFNYNITEMFTLDRRQEILPFSTDEHLIGYNQC